MSDIKKTQKEILEGTTHQLIIGGPGSGKTTIAIKKAVMIVNNSLDREQNVILLSFARATIARILEAMNEENAISKEILKNIQVETYHAFFWKILKTHGYLVGLPKKLKVLTPPEEAVVLSHIRRKFKNDPNLNDQLNNTKNLFAEKNGRVCFDEFASKVNELLNGSSNIRKLISNKFPYIILDEFQDTNSHQWGVVRALGQESTLIVLADPNQRIYEFNGADPKRICQFKQSFSPDKFDLSGVNFRSTGTDIVKFGNNIITGNFISKKYSGIIVERYNYSDKYAYELLLKHVTSARSRVVTSNNDSGTLAILVPTNRLTRIISDLLRNPIGNYNSIEHSVEINMEGPLLAAEVIAYLMQPNDKQKMFQKFINLVIRFYLGRGGKKPIESDLQEADRISKALQKWNERINLGKNPPKVSCLQAFNSIFEKSNSIMFIGNPEEDWIKVRDLFDYNSSPNRISKILEDVRYLRLLNKGEALRSSFVEEWMTSGSYKGALQLTRDVLLHEQFDSVKKSETGVIIMNMHKAKGKQFDEVIIFEKWPIFSEGKIVSNRDRIVNMNSISFDSTANLKLHVSVTRAKNRATILTPQSDPCVLLKPYFSSRF